MHFCYAFWIIFGLQLTIWSWESKPFGEDKPNEDVDKDGKIFKLNLRFPGQYYDVETGKHYNINRDYDPVTGRYIQSDPIGFDGGINTYLYVGANPVVRVDESGLIDPRLKVGLGQNWDEPYTFDKIINFFKKLYNNIPKNQKLGPVAVFYEDEDKFSIVNYSAMPIDTNYLKSEIDVNIGSAAFNSSSHGNIFKLKPYEGKINAMYSTLTGSANVDLDLIILKLGCKGRAYAGAIGVKGVLNLGGDPKFKVGLDLAFGAGAGGECYVDW